MKEAWTKQQQQFEVPYMCWANQAFLKDVTTSRNNPIIHFNMPANLFLQLFKVSSLFLCVTDEALIVCWQH
jgi:hypothetical protein